MKLGIFLAFFWVVALFATDSEVTPVSYNGRFIPLAVYQQQIGENRSFGSPQNSAFILEENEPIRARLQSVSEQWKVLPSRYGEWISIHALKLKMYNLSTGKLEPIGNFTLYSDQEFENIRQSYFEWEKDYEKAALLSLELLKAYENIAGTPYLIANSNTLYYPTITQLYLENFYHHNPLLESLILLYFLATLSFGIGIYFQKKRILLFGVFFLVAAFIGHTFLLATRSYILNRPPVSNMAETVIYVPWITVAMSLLIRCVIKNNLLLMASSLTTTSLLALLYFSGLNKGLENLQPVLNSRFWLMTHVLMVVGSYGVFILGGVLGHIYVSAYLYNKSESPFLKSLAQAILQTMYLGAGLLIAGTILGGVWAAESWGRFWDWDPKESWAFISICIYLLWIHAYRFHKIGNFGLAIGSIAGLLTISFTWYGVNYILGTGFHSYGFGSGGVFYYVSFFLAEIIFLAVCLWKKQNRHPKPIDN